MAGADRLPVPSLALEEGAETGTGEQAPDARKAKTVREVTLLKSADSGQWSVVSNKARALQLTTDN